MLKSLAAPAMLAAVFLASHPVSAAASAADKATARDLATAGIQLFKDGKYAEALDKLKRAEELYDVPVHLLYIGRTEEKLGHLVESAEAYRQLDHYSMPAGAPAAWVSAQEDGRKELPGVEPRVAKLKVNIEPKDAEGTSLTIDGTPVSAAAIGTERPINPGKHHVEATAKGYKTASGDVEVAEKESKELALTLEKAPPGTEAAAGAGAGAVPGGMTSPSPEEEKKSGIGFLVGLRFSAVVPTGKIMVDPADPNHEINISDGFQPGGGVELHAGIRIAQLFTPVVFFEGDKYTPGDRFSTFTPKNPSGASVGLGLIFGSAPGKIGGFGEFDIAGVHTLSLEFKENLTGNTCKVTASGPAVRFGGGGTFPVASWLNITPYAMVTIGKPTKLGTEGCNPITASAIEGTKDSDLRTPTIISLGVGGDLILGKDH